MQSSPSPAVCAAHPHSPRSTRTAFTLVELLVVIGIIALLIAILLPVLGKARDSANRAACLSNMRQLGTAFVMYTTDNKGYFPYNTAFLRGGFGGPGYPPGYGADPLVSTGDDFVTFMPHPEDWVYWQQKFAPGYRDMGESAIAKYLGAKSEAMVKILRCPSDSEALNRQPGPGAAPCEGAYTFSYTLNAYMSLQKISRVTRSAEKLLLIEENNPNDGRWAPRSAEDPLSVRHGKKRASSQYAQVNGYVGIGVPAAFVDGHGAIIDEDFSEDPRNYLLGNP